VAHCALCWARTRKARGARGKHARRPTDEGPPHEGLALARRPRRRTTSSPASLASLSSLGALSPGQDARLLPGGGAAPASRRGRPSRRSRRAGNARPVFVGAPTCRPLAPRRAALRAPLGRPERAICAPGRPNQSREFNGTIAAPAKRAHRKAAARKAGQIVARPKRVGGHL